MAEAIKNPICCRGNGQDSTSRAQWRICVYFFLLIFGGGLFILLEKTERHSTSNKIPFLQEKRSLANVTNIEKKSPNPSNMHIVTFLHISPLPN